MIHSDASPTGAGDGSGVPSGQLRPLAGSLTVPGPATYDWAVDVNSPEQNIMVADGYEPMLTREEQHARRKEIADVVKEAPLEKRRDVLKSIAKRKKVSLQTAVNSCKLHGVDLPPIVRRNVSEATIKIIGELVKNTPTDKIVKKYAVTKQRVSQIKKEAVEAGILDG